MTGRAIYPEAFVAEFCRRRDQGEPNDRLCEAMKINRKTGGIWYSRHKRARARRGTDGTPEPKTWGQIRTNKASRQAYNDFAYFRHRCFGYKTPPWQVEAIEQLRDAVESGRRDYVCVNVAPGFGKTDMLKHFVCWLIARNRSVRILWGSASADRAAAVVRDVRVELTRTERWAGREEDIETGRADKPRYCMTDLFGRFRPSAHHGTTWSADEFTVATIGDLSDPEGPPAAGVTLAALGKRTGQLGMRANIIIWDDVWTEDEERNLDQGKKIKRFFDRTASTRLQPNGVLCLVMQRLGPNDLSRHVLDKRVPEWDPVSGLETGGFRPEYRHVVYPAHQDDLCTGAHPAGMEPWDPRNPQKGQCLTDPRALPPEDYLAALRNPAWLVMYQQRDIDAANAIIPEVWLTGGRDEDNQQYRGCLDFDRALYELPDGIPKGSLSSVMSVDPGHEGFWGLYWSVAALDLMSETEWVIAAEHRKMPAGTERGLLDWDFERKEFVGLMEQWWQTSKDIGCPITHVVAEINAAQRHLFRRTNVIDKWQASRKVRIISHQTVRNKNDPKLGVEGLLPIRYQLGSIRLPWRPGQTQAQMRCLYDEAKGYQQGWPTDDVLMAQWMRWLNRRVANRPVHAVTPSREGDVPQWVRAMA